MMIQVHELGAWLGDTELTAEQRARFEVEVEVIADRYPDPDDQPEVEAAMSAAVQWILGEVTAEEAGRTLLAARLAAAEALAAGQQVARMAVLDGVTEVAAARAVGLDRMTVRKALGKR